MKIILAIITVFVLIGNNYAQDSITDPTQSKILSQVEEQEIIQDIRKKYKIINDNCNLYKRISSGLMGYSTEGGNIVAYFDNADLRKAVVTYYGETGKVIYEYYVWDNDVFFIFRQDFYYNSPIYWTEDKPEEGIEAYDENKTKIFENRYYFSNDKLIRWIDPDKKFVNPESEEFKKEESDLLKDIMFVKGKISE